MTASAAILLVANWMSVQDWKRPVTSLQFRGARAARIKCRSAVVRVGRQMFRFVWEERTDL